MTSKEEEMESFRGGVVVGRFREANGEDEE